MDTAGNQYSVLVVEDNLDLVMGLQDLLLHDGYAVTVADTVAGAIELVRAHRFNAILLDLGLPDGDGVDLIRDVRGWSAVPIIVLSARSGEADKIAALDAGADDYLTKPFGLGELLARVRANARRPRATATDGTAVGGADALFCFGDVELDRVARLVRRNGAEVHLTPIEYRLLQVLVAHAGRVLTHRHLLREVWGPSHAEQSHYLRIYMGHLRQKLEADPAQPRHLLTETAVGYRLVV